MGLYQVFYTCYSCVAWWESFVGILTVGTDTSLFLLLALNTLHLTALLYLALLPGHFPCLIVSCFVLLAVIFWRPAISEEKIFRK